MALMQRYGGEALGPEPHIVVLGSCKVGNFVVSTPVLRGLRRRFPDAVAFNLSVKNGRVSGVSGGQNVAFKVDEARGAASN